MLRRSTALPSRELRAVEVVDAALSVAVRRSRFTAAEAVELLQGVQTKVRDGAPAEAVARIVGEAEQSYHNLLLVDRAQVVDPLLDLRLQLSG